MSGIEGAALGAAASVGVAAYSTISGFSARHDHSHDAQAAETRRLIDDFNKLRKIGDMDDEDYAVYMEKKEIALQSGKAYRDSISQFKNTPASNPVKKFNKRGHVRKSKRQVREANQSLQDLYYHSSSAGSDASSVTAESGSPPESQAIREWADTMISSSRYAKGTIVDRPGPHITVEQYTLSFHDCLLIEDAKVSLEYGRRYGLLGENGSGKSTFLQSIAERDIAFSPDIKICLVREEADRSQLNAVDFIVASPDNDASLAASIRYKSPEDKAGSILHGLGFSQAMMKEPTECLSSGWRMRVALAQALFLRPHLLLDEPTNYLDVGAIVWLGAYLSTYRRILIITSNSADFMDNLCTNIIDLTSKKLVYYDGNYSAYVMTKRENEVNQVKAYHKQQKEIANIKKVIATAGIDANLIEQAKSKIDKIKAAGLIEPAKTHNQHRFNFEDIQILPPPVIVFDNVAFSYSGNKEDYLHQKLSFGIDMNSRIAILGANGTGKSTFLKLITEALQPSEGIVTKHSSVKLSKYTRHSAERLPDDECPFSYLRSVSKEMDPISSFKGVKDQLDRFGVSRAYWTASIKELSIGLRSKLVFARLAMKRPHVLVWDEPTNHLDMESVDALTRAIKEFQGGVVVVSNNTRFISQVAEELWEVTVKGIRNLTKEGVTIMDYKKTLVNQRYAVIEGPKLFSKAAPKGRA